MQNRETLIYKNTGNRALLDLLPPHPGRVLDCGCGAGDNAKILANKGWRVTGVTIDPQEQEVCEQFCDAVYLANLDNGLPPDIVGTFDAVLASHVLEHLAEPEPLLSDVGKHLEPGGVLAVALPNVAHIKQRISFLKGRFDYTETGQLDRTHLRFYTYKTAIELLERSGYELLYCAVDGGMPWWKMRQLIPLTLIDSANRWAVIHRPNLFGHQSLMIARPSG